MNVEWWQIALWTIATCLYSYGLGRRHGARAEFERTEARDRRIVRDTIRRYGDSGDKAAP